MAALRQKWPVLSIAIPPRSTIRQPIRAMLRDGSQIALLVWHLETREHLQTGRTTVGMRQPSTPEGTTPAAVFGRRLYCMPRPAGWKCALGRFHGQSHSRRSGSDRRILKHPGWTKSLTITRGTGGVANRFGDFGKSAGLRFRVFGGPAQSRSTCSHPKHSTRRFWRRRSMEH